MNLTHAFKVALEQTVKDLFSGHQQQVLYDKNIEEAERQHWEERINNDWIEWNEDLAFGFSI